MSTPIDQTEDTKPDDSSNWPLYNAKEHDQKFNPMAYLEDFYTTAKEDMAMQIVLFFIPGILYRIPQTIETVLDLGAGPTVYIPIAMRNRAKNIYTSDYAEANRDALKSFIKNESTFDWKNVCEWIAGIEASHDSPDQMKATAREKMRAVLHVNVHDSPVIRGIHYAVDPKASVPTEFDVVTTVFCLEYSCETPQDYGRAVKSAASLVKVGGYLIQGGVMEENEYSFGGRRFKCHYLTRDELLQRLKENGFETDERSGNFKLIAHDEIFLLVAKKLK